MGPEPSRAGHERGHDLSLRVAQAGCVRHCTTHKLCEDGKVHLGGLKGARLTGHREPNNFGDQLSRLTLAHAQRQELRSGF